MLRSRFPRVAITVIGASVATVLATAAPALAAQTPTPTINSGPANGSFVASTSATFTFSDKGVAKPTFSCKLDSAAAATCKSPKSYTGLSQGKHTFSVTASSAGQTTSAAATRTWTVDTVAPKPAIAAPTSLTGPVVIAFGEAVKEASAHVTLGTLVLSGTTTTVATKTSCWHGSTSVACATGTFDTVRLTPTSRLTSGQHYTASIGAGVVKDLAGNANTAASKGFRGARNLQENAPGITTLWQKINSSSAIGGSYVREHLASASAGWTFTVAGTSFTWWTVTGPNMGKAAVYVDGALKATVNNYAASTHYKAKRTYSGLNNKVHRVRIVVLGTKSTVSKGTVIAIDAFSVGTTQVATPILGTSWHRLSSTHYSGGHAIVADLRGETLLMTFRGTAITWYTQKGVAQGKAQIWVDGVLKATVDNYAGSTSYNVARTIGSLTDALHTVKIVVLGQHRSGAKGSNVIVDRLFVS